MAEVHRKAGGRRVAAGSPPIVVVALVGLVGLVGSFVFAGSANARGTTSAPVASTSLPAPIPALSKVAAGARHTCALSSSGSILCWGSNGWGELGNGTNTDSTTPTAVTTAGTPLAGKAIAQIVAGEDDTCAVTSDGIGACWGANAGGQLGNGTTDWSSVPTAITTEGTPLAGKQLRQLEAGSAGTCALTTDGVVACWGSGNYGQLGNGTTTESLVPSAVTTTGTPLQGKTVSAISVGYLHSCAVTTDGSAACWGWNAFGQLGDATTANASVPVAVTTAGTPLQGTTIATISAGGLHTCATSSTGAAACWGYNSDGQLGNGTTTSSSTPVAVTTTATPLAGATVTDIEAGRNHTCALTASAVAACWGDGMYGQRGDGTTDDSSVPKAITIVGTPLAAKTITDLTAGNYHAGALTSVGTFALWGANPSGQLGNGTLTNSAVPTGAAGAFYATTTPQAPFASWAAFVARQYTDLTAKSPTASQSATWVSWLSSESRTKGDLIEALRRDTDNTTNVDPTARLYRAFLGRAPDASGLRFWITRRRAGTWTLKKMADSFAASNEFKTKYGALTNRQFVTRIYTDVLGRTADTGGVNYWTGKLDSKALTRGQVMVGFSESSEYKRKQAENTDVAVAYIFLMGRSATTAETTDWVTRQKAGTTQAELATELLNSAKYATHITG